MALIYRTTTVITPITGAGFTPTDITGDYNGTTNPGGWGTPNPFRADVACPTVKIQNVCTSEDITPLNGGILPAPWNTLVLPPAFDITGAIGSYPTTATGLIDFNTYYGVTHLPDGLYSFTYQLINTSNALIPTTSVNYAISTVDIDCCISTLANEILSSTCPTQEKKKKFNTLIMWKNALTYAMACENYSAVCSTLAKLSALCNNEGGCGCGC
jgi:hypothetical protein